jgi:hypothetical protein
MQKRFETPHAVKISKRSSLVLDGNVIIRSLDVDGTLVIRVARGATLLIEKLTVRNGGWQLVRSLNNPRHAQCKPVQGHS